MAYEVVRVTGKGQMTIPVRIRKALAIREGDSLIVTLEGGEIRLRKLDPFRPLDEDDPIWQLVGIGESGLADVSENHDRYLAAGENDRWNE
ncbi:MAG: Transcriptional regulator, AbrB family [Clostridia bacterium 62_21]|nr:MAG: Transcriptional regulator, AbrB family [Clostridia bacterium 62_21]